MAIHRPRPTTREAKEADALVDAMPTPYLQCRTLGHAWTIEWWGTVRELGLAVDIPPVVREFRWELVRVSVCLRCVTTRDEFYPRGGLDPWAVWRVQYRRYRYPSGYNVVGHPEIDRRYYSAAAYERYQDAEASARQKVG